MGSFGNCGRNEYASWDCGNLHAEWHEMPSTAVIHGMKTLLPNDPLADPKSLSIDLDPGQLLIRS
jgi:hypothetical protein